MAPTEDLDVAGQDGSELQYYLWVVEVRIPRVIPSHQAMHALLDDWSRQINQLTPFIPSHAFIRAELHTRFHFRPPLRLPSPPAPRSRPLEAPTRWHGQPPPALESISDPPRYYPIESSAPGDARVEDRLVGTSPSLLAVTGSWLLRLRQMRRVSTRPYGGTTIMHANSCALCDGMACASSPAAPSPPLAGLGAGWQTHTR
ncbi:hypothetical protein B0H14DRAFT_3489403 [Mycena olivaceomarginata]|nr:hypothetical protein B0H14DRAFT_3489403 [Mycena olivaceomarginata]